MKLGLFSILTILFILLKVFNVVAWSWLIVFSPLIIGVILWLLLLVLLIFIEATADR
ncbi:hypothetical protein [Leuconostoc pseudomesenteroides]|uniref:Uncharacterized protein n=2 Tax=root TaxID=1 RepID=A0ABT6HBK8_LEUPS|nr:hypothetical protein [Leuconostoc pseudomesenteroides]YP_010083075.1 hypothetical protein KMD26_gp29 [Leuconostoc phage phiMH1]ADP69213.1 hypothetical protein [Leuconostoc phage phiMH1]MDG9733471.1 hypothetical protein [Leuconostoc pseudomesenteroides]NKZ36088.1 hypothetical protein [Leuconostoc pseudomesenteroides]QQB26686.1 hypothetical protein I6H60_06340 [Leuconostoc pseudomesenteroides]QQB26734.1 hypothetical protein I6H60_06605 [Leuconostoc pseudomesenteroides]